MGSENRKAFRIKLKAQSDMTVERPFCARDVYNALLKMNTDLKGQEKVLISDVFSAGFVYKPICLDLAELMTDSQFKLMKKIRKAKFIDRKLLQETRTAMDLIGALEDGRVRIKGAYICRALSEDKIAYEETAVPSRGNSSSIRVRRGAELEFYIKGQGGTVEQLEQMQYIDIPEGSFSERRFSIESTKDTDAGGQSASLAVIEADAWIVNSGSLKVTGDDSCFRVGLNAGKQVFFKAGSTFTEEDLKEIDRGTAGWMPYVIWRGK